MSPAPPTRHEIAARLRQAAAMLRLQGENRFRAGAYERGAEALESLSGDLAELVEQARLTEVPGIGASLAAVVGDLVRRGHSPTLERIMEFPPALLEMARVPGMTWPRIRALHAQLGIETLAELRDALAAGAVGDVKGFGPRTVEKLRAATADDAPRDERVILADALDWADRLVSRLRAIPAIVRAEVVGSVRRAVETVGDVNLLVATHSPEAAAAALASYPAVLAVDERAQQRCRVRLTTGLTVTLAAAPPEAFARAYLRATGSAAHVRRLEERAHAAGLDLDGWTGDDEAAIYQQLGLPFIPPELREDGGEFEAAEAGDDFRDLITVGDLRGAVHCHTVHSDGRDTVAAMAEAAAARGLEYLTITDHSPTASYAGGVPLPRLPDQWRDIALARAQGVRIFRGTESDILPSGGLDYANDVLATLDVVVASIHERHKMSGDAMTERLVTAMRHPVFKIWGHPLGRLLLRRPPIHCDVERVLDAAAQSRAAIEVNGSPYRLDLPSEWIGAARRRGLKFVISVDAHSTAELDNVHHGVRAARRGGLRRSDVLNTLSAGAFAQHVSPARG